MLVDPGQQHEVEVVVALLRAEGEVEERQVDHLLPPDVQPLHQLCAVITHGAHEHMVPAAVTRAARGGSGLMGGVTGGEAGSGQAEDGAIGGRWCQLLTDTTARCLAAWEQGRVLQLLGGIQTTRTQYLQPGM